MMFYKLLHDYLNWKNEKKYAILNTSDIRKKGKKRCLKLFTMSSKKIIFG